MDLKDLGRMLAKVGLPLLGAALPIPGGAALGTALATTIGAPSDSPEDILKTLTTSEEARQKAAEFQATHRERMVAMLLDYDKETYRTETEDRKDARHAAVEGGNAARTYWFAVLIFVVVSGIEGFLLVHGFPGDIRNPELFGRLLGTLDAAMLAALYYIFGSSAGSDRKTTSILAATK